MASIFEILVKLPEPLSCAINCFSKNPILSPLKDVVHNLQLSYYYLKDADEEMRSMSNSIELTQEGSEQKMPVAPSLIGTQEQLEYLKKHLIEMRKDIRSYLITVDIPQEVYYNVRRGYDKITEALFNTNITVTYYDEYNKQLGTRK